MFVSNTRVHVSCPTLGLSDVKCIPYILLITVR